MNAVRAGYYVFNERALVPSLDYPWDDYAARLFRYALFDAYANNNAYDAVTRFSGRLKETAKLYRHVRGIYNPVSRLEESYVDKLYGGTLDFDTLEGGAVPLVFADEASAGLLRDAIRNIWLWSNIRLQKDLYVRTGVRLGDVALKVVDEPDKRKVRIEVLHPGKIRDVTLDAVRNVKAITIEYERDDAATGKPYIYTETIDGDEFRTYKDGEPYAYYEDGQGERVAAWRNPYGFVPVVLVQHRSTGMTWGMNAFHAQIGKINEVNDAASVLGDAVRKSVTPMLRAIGFQPNAKISFDTTARDEMIVLYGPEGSAIEPLAPSVDIAAAGANIDRLLLELERDLPELALHRLREGGNLTAPGVRAAYADAIGRYRSAMSVYDDGLIRAQKMALSIGGFRGYDGFKGITLDSYARGELEHFIRERAVVDDVLSRQERIAALQALPLEPPKARLILQELGYSAQQIDDVVAELTLFAQPAAGFGDIDNLLSEIGVGTETE